jgi:mandelate racemase
MSVPQLTARAIRARPVMAPMRYALGTSAATVRTAPLLLVDLITEEGVVGHAYQFCYTPAAQPAIVAILNDVEGAIRGDSLAPLDVWAKLAKRYTLIGVEGIVRMAMSLVDVAAWDALAKAAKLPLARYLGAEPKSVPAYNSNGLGLMAPAAVADEAEKLAADGFEAVKLRLGYATLQGDLAAVRAVRGRLGDGVQIPVDYNQALSVAQAAERCRALDDEGLLWIEEPIRHDDYAGCASLARETRTPIQIGENFSQVFDMEKAIAAGAADFVMPDLERIGGVTGWLRAAALAQTHALPMSSHLYPEVSVHLLAATPTAHWLEYVDWLEPLVTEPLRITDGQAIAPERDGLGIEWNEESVKRLAV